MAVQILGYNSVIQEVDATHRAARVSMRPWESLNWTSIGVQTGAITGLAAAAPIFSLRYAGTGVLLFRRIGLGFIATSVFTTAQRVEFGAFFARNFTVSDSGGTPITLFGTGNNKHRTSQASLSSGDIRVAQTGALTLGTRTLDASPISYQAVHIAAVGSSIQPSLNNLLQFDSGDNPLIVANNEGIVVANNLLMGAGGAGVVYLNFEFAEVATF